MSKETIRQLRLELAQELEKILRYWDTFCYDRENGGFRCVLRDGTLLRDGAKGAVLNGRALWTFSAACRLTGDKRYGALAGEAFEYCKNHFIDKEYGWVFPLLSTKNEVLDDNKDMYAGTFILFAFTEYYLATGNRESLDLAIQLYTELETHAHDTQNGGYFDLFRRDWSPVMPADGTADDSKSLRTQLHVLECYTNLSVCWPDPGLKQQIEELLQHLCTDAFDQETGALKQHFTADWRALDDEDVYGDDIEGSWLFPECAALSGADGVKASVADLAEKLMRHVLEQGHDGERGGLFSKNTDHDKDWWSQCEAMNAYLDFYARTGESRYLTCFSELWNYIKTVFTGGDGAWMHKVTTDGTPLDPNRIAMCPYHSGRACMRAITAFDGLLNEHQEEERQAQIYG